MEADDPLLVEVQAEDLWCEGYNMRTGSRGIFPAFYAVKLTKDELVKGKPWLFYGILSIWAFVYCAIMSFSAYCDLFRGQRWLDGQILGEIPWFCSSAVSQRERCALCRHAQGILFHFCIIILPWISIYLHNNYKDILLFICNLMFIRNLIMSTDSIKQKNNNAVQPPFALHSGNRHKRSENHCSGWLSDIWKGLYTSK